MMLNKTKELNWIRSNDCNDEFVSQEICGLTPRGHPFAAFIFFYNRFRFLLRFSPLSEARAKS